MAVRNWELGRNLRDAMLRLPNVRYVVGHFHGPKVLVCPKCSIRTNGLLLRQTVEETAYMCRLCYVFKYGSQPVPNVIIGTSILTSYDL